MDSGSVFCERPLLAVVENIISNLQLLFKLGRPVEVATRGHSFIISFSKTLTFHEVSAS